MKTIKKIFSLVTMLVFTVCILPSFLTGFEANAAPSKPTLKNDPINGQILPYYDVWLHWYDISNESYYTMTIRDITNSNANLQPLIYYDEYVAKNATYFIVPKGVLTRGHKYRWCLNAVDSNGVHSYADAHVFSVELYNPDRHLKTLDYPKNRIDYYVYAESTSYDTILNNAAQAWNGIANVSLVRTTSPPDGVYELRIYESPSPANSNSYGLTVTHYDKTTNEVLYAEVQTYKSNISKLYTSGNTSNYIIKNVNTYYYANAMHEVGHALGLEHTWNDSDMSAPYDISTSTETGAKIPLVMNSGP